MNKFTSIWIFLKKFFIINDKEILKDCIKNSFIKKDNIFYVGNHKLLYSLCDYDIYKLTDFLFTNLVELKHKDRIMWIFRNLNYNDGDIYYGYEKNGYHYEIILNEKVKIEDAECTKANFAYMLNKEISKNINEFSKAKGEK